LAKRGEAAMDSELEKLFKDITDDTVEMLQEAGFKNVVMIVSDEKSRVVMNLKGSPVNLAHIFIELGSRLPAESKKHIEICNKYHK